jgi:hypothetical protein
VVKTYVLLIGLLISGSAYAGKPTAPPLRGDVGPAGAVGANGSDAAVSKFEAGLGAGVRLFDTRLFSGGLLYQHGFIRPSNSIFGMVGLKLGSSYEERELDKLREQISSYIARQGLVEGKEARVVDREKPVRAVIKAR